jgi:hypothetical protein
MYRESIKIVIIYLCGVYYSLLPAKLSVCSFIISEKQSNAKSTDEAQQKKKQYYGQSYFLNMIIFFEESYICMNIVFFLPEIASLLNL